MISVLGMWERWPEPERLERRLWKATIEAFAVDAWSMCDVYGGPFTSPVQYEDLVTMIAAHPGPKTFLIPPGRVDKRSEWFNLDNYDHPNGIYVFGCARENLVRYVTPADDVVSICTPQRADLFGAVALAAVLYDRMVKLG